MPSYAYRSPRSRLAAVAYADPGDIPDSVDAVCVVTPTRYHLPVARPFLKRGVATFIEKPLALSVEEARELVRLSNKSGAILQVGHIERFNPAWEAVDELDGPPTFIHARRASRFPFRSLDVSVVFDVMIHDLELALALVDAPVDRVEAIARVCVGPKVDEAEVWVEFANGCQATFSASRFHHEAHRSMRVMDASGTVEIDFMRRQSIRNRTLAPRLTPRAFPPNLTPVEKETLLQGMFASDVRSHDPQAEPLRRELEDFVASVRTGRLPRVTGEQAYAAVVLASRIEAAIGAGHGQSGYRRSA